MSDKSQTAAIAKQSCTWCGFIHGTDTTAAQRVGTPYQRHGWSPLGFFTCLAVAAAFVVFAHDYFAAWGVLMGCGIMIFSGRIAVNG